MIPFTIFPAIDLRAGQVVRLAQGDPTRQTIYTDDPVAVAERWKSEGAEWLHVVNLDGAFGDESHANLQALAEILRVGLNVEFGGGLRDQASLRTALDMGVARVFIGTAAIQNPALVDWAVATYGPARIAGDIGAREGWVTIKGWQEMIPLTVLEVGQRFRNQGIEWCVLTDVTRDGLSAGVNVASAVKLQQASGLRVVASGGVSSADDVCHVREAGLAGVIVGRALYEGRVKLGDLMRV